MSKTFKILSLDGGGIRGVISATILKKIETTLKEKKNGQKLHEYFDLIAGTSTGSILAAGIACQMEAQQLINVYKEQGKDIFLESVRQQRKWRWLSQILGGYVLYPHERGEQGLAQVLKRNLIHQGKCPTIADIKQPNLLILAYDVLSRNTTWFANDDDKEWYYKNKTELWKICTASAPTFFPPYELRRNSEEFLPHIDGGVAANNPELAAIAHALSMQINDQGKTRPKIEEIAVLSIGTGRTTRPYEYSEIKKWGLLDWAKNIPNIFLDPSAENSNYISRRIFNSIGSENYLRLDFDLNEQFEPRQSGRPKKKLKKPYNKYVLKKDDKNYKCITEEMDNPEKCQDLIEAAECYLEYGEVAFKKQNIEVRSAIEQFIESH
ncbi:patatin-like phospholipase family protein [Nostoc sp. GT001]|uniref:patatin-like phospholipase family protein n=1 Tax=Nostoc sp. GT001 TaxID=3056647 RepID=UPI0025AAB0FB|nr:patatin-like phospholipase family protein [Nostoc sp. GT001]MDM9584148.1 patatin-like phospholipase family protein [Nostoc sp. GT001]